MLWSAPVNPASEEVGASIRLDQSPLRRDQISVKLSSPRPSPARRRSGRTYRPSVTSRSRIGSPRVLSRGRARSAAPRCEIMRHRSPGRAVAFVDARAHVFARSVMPCPCAQRRWQPWWSPSVCLMGASHATSNGRIRPEGRLRLDRLPATATPAFFPCREVAAFLARQKSRLPPSSAALRA